MAIRRTYEDDQPGGFNPPPQGGYQVAPAPATPPPPPPQPPLAPQIQQATQQMATPPGYNYTQFRDRWMGSGVNTVQGAQDWLAKNQDVGQGVSMVGDKFDLNHDGVGDVDVIMGAKSGGGMAGPQWTNPYAAQGAGGAAGAPGAGGAGAAGGGGGGFQDQIRQIILSQLGQLGKPVTATDPAIASEMQAQEAVLERTRQQRRAAMAERAATQGLLNGGQSSGAFDADVASGIEDKGQALTGLQSQLFGRELQNRRATMSQMLNMAMQSGDAEAARAVQLQIAAIDAELRRAGLSEQGRQFDLGLGQRQNEWNDQNDLSWANFYGGRL